MANWRLLVFRTEYLIPTMMIGGNALAQHALGGGGDGLPDGPRNAKYVPRYGVPAVAKER